MRTATRTSRFNLGTDRGQSMVEFAIVLPFIVVLFLAIWHVGVAFHNYIAITDAARVGARAAVVKRTTGSCLAARTAVQNTVSATQWTAISPQNICSTTSTPSGNVGDPFTVTINYAFTIDALQVFGLPALTGTMTARATERLE